MHCYKVLHINVNNWAMSNLKVTKNYEIDSGSPNPGWGYRHLQAFILFLVLGCAFSLRTSMSIAIIAMTDKTKPDEQKMIFEWPKIEQDYILSSFYWGYMVMQVPAGQLAYQYGGKMLVTIGLISNGFATLMIPVAATLGGWKGVCLFRGLQGVAQGCLVPSIHTLLGKWSPVTERNRMGAFIYNGSSFGILVALPLSGFLSDSRLGWTSIFYTFGVASIVIGSLWAILGADSPAKHKKISPEEKRYIEESIGETETKNTMKVPWRAILTSPRVFALVVTQGGSIFGFVMLQTEIPSYLKMAHKVDVKNSALLSILPVTAGWIFALATSQIADYILNRKIFSIITVRKVANTAATWVPAILLVVLTTIPAGNVTLSIGIITLIAGFDTVCCAGFVMNHIDLSPRFAGTLMSLSNLAGAICAQMAPLSAGAILDDPNDISQWRNVFFLSAAACFFSNLVFIIFGTADRQPWDNPKNFLDIELSPAAVNLLEAQNVAIDKKEDKNTN